MPIYSFYCENCGNRFEKFVLITKYKKTRKCPKCGSKVYHDIIADHRGGNVDSQMREYLFDSDTGTRLYPLGVLPNQIDEERKRNPDIEYRLHNGCYLPVVHNRTEKLKLLKRKNYVELD